MLINFVGPDPSQFISGGNSYNRSLIDALESIGHRITIRSTPDEQGGVQIIDSIVFGELRPDRIPGNSISLLHHLPSLYPGPQSKFESEELPLLKGFSHHIVTSHFMLQWMVGKGFPEDSISVLEPVCEIERQTSRSPSPKVRAVLLNNVVERKGVLPLLKELASRSITPTYELTIVGDLDIDQKYSQLCLDFARGDKNLSKTTRFKGSQGEKSVRKIMSRSNLFISASFFETFGMSIQEASVLGLPLLVRKGGNACNHIQQRVNGFCAADASELAKHIDQMNSNPDQFLKLQVSAQNYVHPYARNWTDHAHTVASIMNAL